MTTNWQLVKSGVFAGCNVENMSFGFLGLRRASGRSYAAQGERNFVALADRDHYEEPASVRRMPPMRGTFLVRQ
jgi:hypothetical protein